MVLSEVKKYIETQGLLTDNSRVLVAFSGGPDSVVLLDVLQSLHYSLLAVHVNFHLRGEESDRDEAFARKCCQERRIELLVEHLYAREEAQRQGISIEMAAREMRYARFEAIRRERGMDCIAVGHHRDDSLETFFLNFLRGSSLRGLTGIRPKNGFIVRPLLCIDRKSILTYIQEHSLDYITDSSNLSCDYKRNKIRLKLLPLLEEIQPSARKTMARSLDFLSETERWYEDEIDRALQRLQVAQEASLSVSELENEKLPQGILYAWLSAYGFDSKTISTIWKGRHAESGRFYEAPQWRLLLDRDRWLLSPQKEQSSEPIYVQADATFLSEPVCLTIEYVSSEVEIPKDSHIASLDFDTLHFPLTLRRPKQGDRFVPFGMKGHKLLSDYFIDRKMNRYEKEQIWLLCSEEEVVWVVGERIDARYAVGPKTRKVMQIALLTNTN